MMGVAVGDGVAVGVDVGLGVLVNVVVGIGRLAAVAVGVFVAAGIVADGCTATFVGVEPQAAMRLIRIK